MQTNSDQPAMPAKANDSRTASDEAVVCKELLGGWISVKEKLPPLELNVLVCEQGEVTTIAYREVKRYGSQAGQELWHVFDNGGGYEHESDDCNPEYWMLLPNPPNAKLTDAGPVTPDVS